MNDGSITWEEATLRIALDAIGPDHRGWIDLDGRCTACGVQVYRRVGR